MRRGPSIVTPRPRQPRQAGQAMIELMLGMIMLLILLTGSVLFLIVADTHTGMDAVIRGSTGLAAMQPIATLDTPRYIQNWDAGPDGQRFTADDTATCVTPTTLQTIANKTVANNNQWLPFADLQHSSTMESLHQNPAPLMSLGFRGIHRSADVSVPQFVQDLFYPDATVRVQADTWLPILNGLY